jgi:imidazoleglycerol-phosphate dehydratase
MRTSTVNRKTNETDIQLMIDLDGTGNTNVDTGIGFFDHMLNLFGFHGCFDLNVLAKGDLDVDDHHTIEDIGITFAQAFKQAIGDKKGIARYGSFRCCMDEALACVDLDISGRGYLVFNAEFNREMIGMMSTEMVKEFFYAFAINAGVTLHINLMYGENDHHKVEAIFKAFGHALKEATRIQSDTLLSTKGTL